MSPIRSAAALTAIMVGLLAAGCGVGHPPPIGDGSPAAVPTGPSDPQGRLAALAATAQDRRFIATYTLVSKGRVERTVLASVAADGTWRVDVPGGALSGGGDVSMVGAADGTYQCLLGGTATTMGPPATAPSGSPGPATTAPARYPAPACVRVAAAGAGVPHRFDPVFEHPFTDWLAVMVDRAAAIDVVDVPPLLGSSGTCFGVGPTSASLAPPIDRGVYCFAPDGTLTAASIAAGTLTLDQDSGTAPPPPTNALPASVTPGPAAPAKMPANP